MKTKDIQFFRNILQEQLDGLCNQASLTVISLIDREIIVEADTLDGPKEKQDRVIDIFDGWYDKNTIKLKMDDFSEELKEELAA